MNTKSRTHFFSELLNFFWLRPENAILLTLRAEKYRKAIDAYHKNEGKSMDVSCGDGVFTFLTCGGGLDHKTDMFLSVDAEYKTRLGNFDTFDYYDEGFSVSKTREAEFQFTYGTDWKENLLKKASGLDFYDQLIHHDNNKKFSVEDNSLNFIYSNSAYWVSEIEYHLNDLCRMLKPGGKLVLEFKTKRVLDYKSDKYMSFMGDKFHEIIDAGRASTWKGLKGKDEILALLEGIHNLEIASVEPVYGAKMGEIWDVGLRPLFKPLVMMANKLTSEDRVAVKKEWCGIFEDMFSDFIESYDTVDEDAFEFMIVLNKK